MGKRKIVPQWGILTILVERAWLIQQVDFFSTVSQWIDDVKWSHHGHTGRPTFQKYLRVLGALVSHPGINALTKVSPVNFGETYRVVFAGFWRHALICELAIIAHVGTDAITGIPRFTSLVQNASSIILTRVIHTGVWDFTVITAISIVAGAGVNENSITVVNYRTIILIPVTDVFEAFVFNIAIMAQPLLCAVALVAFVFGAVISTVATVLTRVRKAVVDGTQATCLKTFHVRR